MKTARVAGGYEMNYRSDTALAILKREFLNDRLYEQADISLNDGDCVVDVGANIGFFLLHLNRSLAHATVYCFEPIPETFELLERNAHRNDRLDARLFNFGLGEREGEFEFKHYPRMNVNSSMRTEDTPEMRHQARRFVYEEMRTRSRVCRALFQVTPRLLWWPVFEGLRRWGSVYRTERCAVRTLSDVLASHPLPRIDLLKIDVEGAEEDVLRGIRDELWSAIRQLMIETHFGIDQAVRVAEELRRRGFHVKWFPCVEGVDNLHLVVGVRT